MTKFSQITHFRTAKYRLDTELPQWPAVWAVVSSDKPRKYSASLETVTLSSSSSASKGSIRRFVITEKAPTTRAFSWLKVATTAFTFKTLLRHYAKQELTPRSLNVKLGPRRKGHKGRAVWLA